MIKFLQHKSSQYPPRTYENASADCTIAFAFDITTPGERLTYDAVRSQGKIYIPVNPAHKQTSENILTSVALICQFNIKTINIAGNGLYTTVRYGYDQKQCDEYVFAYMLDLINELKCKEQITLIRSGGQSGFDESGLKTAIKLDIPALCLCPQGWKYRDENGTTICDEQKFKNRFNAEIIL